MTPELTKKLDRIEAACRKVLELDAKATRKPFTIAGGNDADDFPVIRHGEKVYVMHHVYSTYHGMDVAFVLNEADAAFIAYSRAITPDMARALLAQIEKHKRVLYTDQAVHDYAVECLQSIADSFQETLLP